MPAGLAKQANGQTALWLNGQPGWHNLGFVHDVDRDGPVTVDVVLDKSGLGSWRVEKRPVFWGATEDSVMGTDRVTVGQSYAVVRVDADGTETALGTVGDIYEPFQNRSMFDFLAAVTGQGDAYIESAGELSKGATVFASMLLGDDIVLDPKGAADRVRKYLLVRTGHDGKTKFTGAVTPIRAVCTNTVDWGLRVADSKFEIRHTKGGLDRIAEAQRALGLATDYYTAFEEDAKTLLAMRMTNAQFDKFVADVVFPIKSDAREADVKRITAKRGQARDLFRDAKTTETIRNTRWAAANALGEQIDHLADVRVPKSLRLDTATPKSQAQLTARAARVVNGADTDRKTEIHKALLTWRR